MPDQTPMAHKLVVARFLKQRKSELAESAANQLETINKLRVRISDAQGEANIAHALALEQEARIEELKDLLADSREVGTELSGRLDEALHNVDVWKKKKSSLAGEFGQARAISARLRIALKDKSSQCEGLMNDLHLTAKDLEKTEGDLTEITGTLNKVMNWNLWQRLRFASRGALEIMPMLKRHEFVSAKSAKP